MSLLLGHAISIVAVYLYSIIQVDDGAVTSNKEQKISSYFLFSAWAIVECCFVAFFALFLKYIKREYISTFWTTVTAHQFICARFQDATSDEAKIDVFNVHDHLHYDIRDEVKEWVQESWTKWNEEKPEWFSSRVIASIPYDMIPKESN